MILSDRTIREELDEFAACVRNDTKPETDGWWASRNLAVIMAGVLGYAFLPVAALPQVEFPTISVGAGLPGASPETMASAVATPLERQFGRIAGVTEMTSSSSLGSTRITLQFDVGTCMEVGYDPIAWVHANPGRIRSLHLKDWGAGDPVILLSGWPLSADSWDDQAMVIAGSGYRVIAYSRRSYFNSDPIARERPGIGSADLHGLIELLGLTKFHLVGSAAGGSISRKFAPSAVKAGAVVVDNSSAFRMDPNVPLVIPEINAGRIREHKGIIAVPNCSAITALVPLWPIHKTNRIKRVILSTYQAASGAGANGRIAVAYYEWSDAWVQRLLIEETLPTGRYDQLGTHPGDGLGGGVHATTYSIYTQRYFWAPNGRMNCRAAAGGASLGAA